MFYIKVNRGIILTEENNVFNNIYSIKQLLCINDSVELKFKNIKKSIQSKEINELWIFSISNKLYKEIINYLKESEIKHYVYGRSRIVLYFD